ncbi:MAG: purine-nucleoside phosphorylase [Candidatus Acetothermia bacterium]
MNGTEEIRQSTEWIESRLSREPKVGMVLGSGLSDTMNELVDTDVEFSWEEIPNFPVPSVEGHEGRFISGALRGTPVLIQQGRLHWYEGLPWEDVIYPVRVHADLGVEKLFMTNAAGGINRDFEPGDLCLIKDHINFAGDNPLRGPNQDEFGPRFPDMSHAYSKQLREIAFKVGRETGVDLNQGIYVMTSGPSYETPAEISALRTLGADVVGMSTVPEVITANHSGLEVLAISLVTNKAAGLQEELSHEEVLEVTERTNQKLGRLLSGIVGEI